MISYLKYKHDKIREKAVPENLLSSHFFLIREKLFLQKILMFSQKIYVISLT